MAPLRTCLCSVACSIQNPPKEELMSWSVFKDYYGSGNVQVTQGFVIPLPLESQCQCKECFHLNHRAPGNVLQGGLAAHGLETLHSCRIHLSILLGIVYSDSSPYTKGHSPYKMWRFPFRVTKPNPASPNPKANLLTQITVKPRGCPDYSGWIQISHNYHEDVVSFGDMVLWIALAVPGSNSTWWWDTSPLICAPILILKA